MNELDTRTTWLRRPVTPTLDPQLLALRGACVGAVAISTVWLALGLAAGWPWLLRLGPVGLGLAAVVPFGATLVAMVYAHLLNGPMAVRVVPNEWIITLGSIGPITVTALMGWFVGWSGASPVMPMALMAVGGGLATIVMPFAMLPLVAAWTRHYRSDDAAAFVVTSTTGALVLAHGAFLVWLL